MRAYLSSKIPPGSVIRKIYRRLRSFRQKIYDRDRSYLFVFGAVDDSLPSAESLLGPGERFIDVAADDLRRPQKLIVPARIDRMLRMLKGGNYVGGIADSAGTLIALYCISRTNTIGNSSGGLYFHPRGMGYLFNAWVVPEHRGRGLGFAMNLYRLRRFGKEFRTAAFVLHENAPALRNWEKCRQPPAVLIDCRRYFSGPWRHRATILTSSLKEFPPEDGGEVNLILNGPLREWRDGDFRMISRPSKRLPQKKR